MGFVNQYKDKGLIDGQQYKHFEQYAMTELYRKKFDGRQIRNILMTAMGHARGRDENDKLTIEDVRDVVVYVEDFKTDLRGQMLKWEEGQKSTRI